MNSVPVTAAEMGLVSCEACQLLSKPATATDIARNIRVLVRRGVFKREFSFSGRFMREKFSLGKRDVERK